MYFTLEKKKRKKEMIKKKKINQTENPNTLLGFLCRNKDRMNLKETKGKGKYTRH